MISGENDGSGKDDLGSDITKVTSITFDGQKYNEWNNDGEIVIDTGTAIATFNQDGSYSYQSTQAEGQVKSFSTNDMLNNNGIELYAYSDYRQVDVTNLNTNSASVVNISEKLASTTTTPKETAVKYVTTKHWLLSLAARFLSLTLL